MKKGKILYAFHDGTYLLKIIGEFRLVSCCSIDYFSREQFSGIKVNHVIIDLTETDFIDSTVLGLLANIAIEVIEHFLIRPSLVCSSKTIYKSLMSMRFDKVYNIIENSEAHHNNLKECPLNENDSELEICERTLRAHKALIKLSVTNKIRFHDVITSLEKDLASYR